MQITGGDTQRKQARRFPAEADTLLATIDTAQIGLQKTTFDALSPAQQIERLRLAAVLSLTAADKLMRVVRWLASVVQR